MSLYCAVQLHVLIYPIFGQRSGEVALGIAIFCWVLFHRLSVVDLDTLEGDLRLAVITGLREAELTVKDAAVRMGTGTEDLRKALHGEPGRHVHLDQLVRLPFRFWIYMLPTLSAIVLKRHVLELADDASSLMKRKVS